MSGLRVAGKTARWFLRGGGGDAVVVGFDFSGEVTESAPFTVESPSDRIDNQGSNKPYFLRLLIPREAGRQVWLNPLIELTGLLGEWRLEACNLVYNWMEVRT